jgi:hypothetical protein
MNDLHDVLERVSEPRRDWLADSAALLHEGRRRVRRRRLAGGVIASVTVLALAVVGFSQLGGSSVHDASPAATSYADLDLTPLSNAEVEQRCVSAVKLMDPESPLTDFVVPDSITKPNPGIDTHGHEFQTPKPWHVGTRVMAMPRTHKEWLFYGEPTACTIPEAGRTARAITRVSTVAQLRGDCGNNLGIGLDGWQQLTASSDGTDAIALFRSGNGYLVHCYVTGTPRTGVQGQAVVLREDAPRSSDDWYSPEAQCWGAARGPIHCFGDGRIGDHTAAQVDVTLPSGRVIRTDAVDGYWSVAARDDASGRWRAKPGETFATSPVP